MDNSNEQNHADFNYLFENVTEEVQVSYADVRPKTPPQQKTDAQSKWMNWSKNRRRSYQERMKKLEERLAAEEKLKHNTSRQAIKKAKKEASKFIDPEYASKMKEEKLKTISAQVAERPNILDSESESDDDDALKKATEQLKELPVITYVRKLGLLFSVLALILIASALGLEHWTTHDGVDGKVFRGLWSATVNVTTTSGKNKVILDKDKEQWQNALIGLVSASGIMNLLGCLLALSGVCSVLFLKKLYYYHSAAEAFIVSSIAMGCGLLLFFVVYEGDKMPGITIGPSPLLSCAAFALQIGAAVIMNLDILTDLLQRCAKRK